jgi:ParB family chromosome partitioning protein
MSSSKHFKSPGEAPADPVMADLLKLGKPGERREGPSTFVGRVGMQAGLGFAAENERLKAERADGMVLLRLDPKTIGRTRFANRNERSLSSRDAKFKRLKASILAEGQDTPIRVRPAAAGSDKEYELVEGHRRHAAILELDQQIEGGFLILARLDAKAAEAKDLFEKMYRENAEREDLSAFETGSMFAQGLTAGIYRTQRELAARMGLDEATVSQYLTIANLPPEVLSAFGDVRLISMRWSAALAKACKEHGAETLARARKCSRQEPRPEAEAVYKLLTGAGTAARPKRRGSKLSESVKVDNKVLFTVALKDGRFAISPKQIEASELPMLYEDLQSYVHRWLSARKRAKG